MLTFEEQVASFRNIIANEWSAEEQADFFFGGYITDLTMHLRKYHLWAGIRIRQEYSLWGTHWMPEIANGNDMSLNHPSAISFNILKEVWKQGYIKVDSDLE